MRRSPRMGEPLHAAEVGSSLRLRRLTPKSVPRDVGLLPRAVCLASTRGSPAGGRPRMRFSGERELQPPVEEVWAALHDSHVLGATIPRCQELVPLELVKGPRCWRLA
jgi:hypothetical protein